MMSCFISFKIFELPLRISMPHWSYQLIPKKFRACSRIFFCFTQKRLSLFLPKHYLLFFVPLNI